MNTNRTHTFEEILENNKDKIYRISRVYAVSPMEPQDLFQEVVKTGKSSIDTWIYKIALNVCMRAKMKLDRNNDKVVRLSSIKFMPSETIPDENEQEKYQFLQECITTLNEADGSIVILYLEELSYKEISVITGLTENHVAVKMKRIRKQLFDCITPKMN